MGAFQTLVEVINRTSKPLNVRYDGQDMTLEPNYTPEGELIPDVHNMIPEQTVPYAKAQNPLMGSEDAIDPSNWQTLVGRKAKRGEKQRDEIDFLEQSDVLTRVDLKELLGDDQTVKNILVRGKVEHRAADQQIGAATQPFNVRAS
jgi:hypothetical protein